MKRLIKIPTCAAFFWLVTLTATAAAQKYQSLLWEISGNGLQKKSYIYGTMHVSGRIAYHLGEEFYSAILEVDAMALESNPIIWLDEINNSKNASQFLGRYSISSRTPVDFYKNAFELTLPANKDLGASISSSNFLMNWLLYRENKSNADFEEDTFLDMFIYQAGRKNNKPVYSLENFKQTNILSIYANFPDDEETEASDWYVKLTKDKTYWELMEDAYRKQNLDLLDSLQAEVSGKNYLKYMLFERNAIMVKNIDSILQTGQSLFSGVGAAHLAGPQGMIEGLRNAGYTVSPIKPTITDKAKAEKERLNKLKLVMPMMHSFSTDLFRFDLPAPMYETYATDYMRDFFCPELTNGSFYSAAIVSTYAFLNGNANVNFMERVDSLLFEYVPGNIISKKRISRNGFSGFDIVNKTKTGDFQRYHIFFTPIHVLLFKMGGKHDWVNTASDSFFKSINLSSLEKPWQKVSPLRGDFEVEVPGYHSIKNNTKILGLYNQPELEAFDSKDSTFYMVKRGVYNDLDYIEEDAFELHRIIDKFLETLKIDSAEVVELGETNGYPSITARALTQDKRYLHLKSMIKGAQYYLLLSVEKDVQPNKRFFDSFQFIEPVYLFESEVIYDSIMRFETKSNHLYPDPYIQQVYQARELKEDRKIDSELEKSYNQDRFYSYFSENYEEIGVDLTVYSPYYHIKDMNKRWDEIIKYHAESDLLYPFAEKRGDENGMQTMEVSFADSTSSRVIHKKFLLNLNRMYVLQTNEDTVSAKSAYVANFFNSFKPINNDPMALSVFDDKAKLFFQRIYDEDSLVRDAAFKALDNFISFDENHVEEMIQTIKNFPFTSDYISTKTALIRDLGFIKHPDVLPFLESYYLQSSDNSLYQIAVLNALARQKTKKATQLLVKLLDKDIPVVNDTRVISRVFGSYRDTLELTSYLFPDLLNYTFVNKTYEDVIYGLLSEAVSQRKINPKKYAKFTNDMLKKAQILVKGERSSLQNNNTYSDTSIDLFYFANMLFPFQRNKKVKAFIASVYKLNNAFQADLISIMLRNDVKISDDFWEKLQNDTDNYANFAARVEFLDEKLKKDVPLNLIDKEKLCRSSLFFNRSWNAYDEKKDSIIFVSKEFVETRREKGWVYFYKVKREKDDLWTLAYIGIQPDEDSKFTTQLNQNQTGIAIPRGGDLDELIREQLKSIQLQDRPRASEDDFGGFDYDFW